MVKHGAISGEVFGDLNSNLFSVHAVNMAVAGVIIAKVAINLIAFCSHNLLLVINNSLCA
jgi:hypothetical protein